MTTLDLAAALRPLLRLAAALSLAGAAACIQIQAELPEICRAAQITYRTPANALVAGDTDQTVQFLPADLVGGLGELQLTGGHVAINPANAVVELRMAVRPPAGSTEFDLALLHLQPAGEGGPIPGSRADLLPFLGGELVFHVTGAPPDGTTLSVSLCVSAKALKEYKLAR